MTYEHELQSLSPADVAQLDANFALGNLKQAVVDMRRCWHTKPDDLRNAISDFRASCEKAEKALENYHAAWSAARSDNKAVA